MQNWMIRHPVEVVQIVVRSIDLAIERGLVQVSLSGHLLLVVALLALVVVASAAAVRLVLPPRWPVLSQFPRVVVVVPLRMVVRPRQL